MDDVQPFPQPFVEKTIWLDAAPEDVFDFFVEPKKLLQWMGVEAEIEARPGGRFRIVHSAEFVSTGEYVEVDRPRRLVYTIGWEGDDNVPSASGTVQVTLTPDQDGTRLALTHHGLLEGSREADGWSVYLRRLQDAAAGKHVPVDPLTSGALSDASSAG
ncbi:MAG: SRPBCC domain-containing protein [Pseudomonadota bacterium]